MTKVWKSLGIFAVTGLLVLLPAGVASADTFTVDFVAQANTGPFSSLTVGLATFTAVTLGDQLLVTPATGFLDCPGTDSSCIIGSSGPFTEIRVDFASLASFVSIDLGDVDADSDLLFLEVFDSLANSIGFVSSLIPGDFIGLQTLSLSVSNIAYAIFGARAPAVSGSSVFADNLVFTVPEPGTLLLLGAGLFAIGAVRLRKRLRT